MKETVSLNDIKMCLDSLMVEMKDIKHEQRLTYTTKEVAKLLNFNSTDKVDLLRKTGALQAIKKGNGYLFPCHIIDEFVHDFIGLDISNEETIRASLCIVKKNKGIKS